MPLSAVKNPADYAREYRNAMRSRWTAPLGDAVRRMTPVVWPGAPPEAFLGFTTDAGTVNPAIVDTALPPVNNSFHEIGYFQTEAGPRAGPAPNPNPTAPDNTWGRIASDPLVLAALGRPLPMAPGAWQTDVPAQTAAGLVALRRHAEGVNRLLDPSIQARDWGSKWAVALGFMGFSAGDGGAARHANRFKAQLAAVPEGQRWDALVQTIANQAAAGTTFSPGGSHSNPAYTVMRTEQKLATGGLAATDDGGDAGWFALHVSDPAAAYVALTAAARGEHPGHTSVLTLEQERAAATGAGLGWLGWLAAAGLTFLVVTRARWVPRARERLSRSPRARRGRMR